MQRTSLKWALWAFLIWAALVTITLALRPLIPIDETRYVSVAWEMWLRHDFLVPTLNGVPYSDKPPLFFWLIHLGWLVSGVNSITPRLINPIFGLLDLLLTTLIARRLWPERKNICFLAPIVLVTTLLWSTFAFTTMFDSILAFWVLVAILGLLSASTESGLGNLALVGGALGFGILTKGPVIFVHVLPVALSLPRLKGLGQKDRMLKWYMGVAISVLIGIAIALIWAVPAGIAGGEAYRQSIFMKQSTGRMLRSFAHGRPWWWYFPVLPSALFPWIFWETFWRNIPRTRMDYGLRFCLVWASSVFIVFSFISGKQIHYLLPIMPPLVLLLLRIASDSAPSPSGYKGHFGIASGFILFGAAAALLPFLGINIKCSGCDPLSIVPGCLMVLLGSSVFIWKSRRIEQSVKIISAHSLALLFIIQLGLLPVRPAYDLTETARRIRIFMEQGKRIVHYGGYSGQYQFIGRLKEPLTVVRTSGEFKNWIKANPYGIVIYYGEFDSRISRDAILYEQPYMKKKVALLRAGALLESGLLK